MEWENKESGKVGNTQDLETTKTPQEEKQEERNWKKLEWITEEKEREKRRNNIIIVGLESAKRCNCKDIEEWLEKEIVVKAKIDKVWRVRTTSMKCMLGIQCGSEKDKKEVMINKKKLGEKDIYI